MKYRVSLINHDVVYQGYFRMERFTLNHERFDGGETGEFQRELFERGCAVAVIPYDPKRDKVILIEQFRVGALANKDHPWLKEIVAGIIEPGESLEEVACRETMEEAGCEITNLEEICEYYVSPGGTSEKCTLYYAEVDSSQAGGIFGLEHEHEDIRVEVVDLDQAYHWIESGQINSATPIIGLQWLMINRARLRQT